MEVTNQGFDPDYNLIDHFLSSNYETIDYLTALYRHFVKVTVPLFIYDAIIMKQCCHSSDSEWGLIYFHMVQHESHPPTSNAPAVSQQQK